MFLFIRLKEGIIIVFIIKELMVKIVLADL